MDDQDYTITEDKSAIDRDQLFAWLSRDAYWWSGGLHRQVLETALDNSLCFSALTTDGMFVGFGRMATDLATFAYWCDVFVAPEHRGRGLGRRLTETALAHPSLATCRRVLLATRDAHEVYRRTGFRTLADPAIFMEVSRPTASSLHSARP